MIKHIWSVLCQKSVIDNESNNITLIDVLERIDVGIKLVNPQGKEPDEVNIPINFEIVTMWENTEPTKVASGSAQIELQDMNGKTINSFGNDIKMKKGMKRLRMRVRIAGLKVNKNGGDFTFSVKFKEAGGKKYKVVAEVPLEVSIKIEDEISEGVKKLLTDTKTK